MPLWRYCRKRIGEEACIVYDTLLFLGLAILKSKCICIFGSAGNRPAQHRPALRPPSLRLRPCPRPGSVGASQVGGSLSDQNYHCFMSCAPCISMQPQLSPLLMSFAPPSAQPTPWVARVRTTPLKVRVTATLTIIIRRIRIE